MSDTQLTVRSLVQQDAYKQRFTEVLRDRAPQFISSLVTLSSQTSLRDCEPMSIVASAMVAATLDFPIEKSLGFAHIVPYRAKGGQKVAQFQLGYKGYIQLSHRSGKFARLNARVVNKEAFLGYDEVGEPSIDWNKIDDTKEVFGYVFAFKLVNGFAKVCFWDKNRVIAHAQRYSQAYRAEKKDSPWFSNFDAMAIKTVIANELRLWAPMSVQDQAMATAMRFDQSWVKGDAKDIGSLEPAYVDGDEEGGEEEAPPERPEKPKGAAAMEAERTEKNVTPPKEEKPAEKPAETPKPEERKPNKPKPSEPKEPAPTPAPAPATRDYKQVKFVGRIVDSVLRPTQSAAYPEVTVIKVKTKDGEVEMVWDPKFETPKTGLQVSDAQCVFEAEIRTGSAGQSVTYVYRITPVSDDPVFF